MAMQPWLYALLGGVLIGGAAALLLRTHGRIAGISGIFSAAFEPRTRDREWRFAFLAGLALAGVASLIVAPRAVGACPHSLPVVAIAGVLVGVGTRVGGGCTSGHGVCGIGRFSQRSLVAVMIFMITGALTVLVTR